MTPIEQLIQYKQEVDKLMELPEENYCRTTTVDSYDKAALLAWSWFAVTRPSRVIAFLRDREHRDAFNDLLYRHYETLKRMGSSFREENGRYYLNAREYMIARVLSSGGLLGYSCSNQMAIVDSDNPEYHDRIDTWAHVKVVIKT